MIFKPANRFVCLATFLLSIGSVASASMSNPPAAAAPPRKAATYSKLPLQFEVNQGQVDPRVKMLARGPGYNILLQPTVATFDLYKANKGHGQQHEAVRMSFAGANDKAALQAESSLPGYVNYMNGPDRSKWQIGIETFAKVRATAIYPGIDALYYGNENQLEFDLVVAPEASASAIRLVMAGAKPVLLANGELVLRAGDSARAEDVRLRKPVLYQMAGNKRELVDGAFTVAANGEVGFRVGAYDHTRELVIDPILSYASYFGGSSYDYVNGTALNAANQLYAVGYTKSLDLPATAGEFQPTNVGTTYNNNYPAAFVTKFSADGSSVLWTTYLTGIGDSYANAVAVNSNDQAYIVGATFACGSGGTSYNTPGEFPFTAGAVQSLCNPQAIGFNNYESNGGNHDAFLVKLSSDGKTELYGTPLGGSADDYASGVSLDANGQVYIVGETVSTQYYYAVSSNLSDVPSYPVNNHGAASIGTANFPTTTTAFYTNATESKMNATTDGSGNVGGPQDEQAFLTVLSADLSKIVYSSLIGGPVLGNAGNGTSATNGIAVAVNANGIAYIGGNTSSAHWPVSSGAFAKTCANAGASNSTCNLTGWLAAFDATKSGAASLLFTTYVNGLTGGLNSSGSNINPSSDVFGLVTDSTGNVVVTGDTNATDFPTTPKTLQPSCFKFGDGNADSNVCDFQAYLAKVSSAGSVVWSTFVGPQVQDGGAINGRGVALDASNNVYLLASSSSSNLPLKNPVVSTVSGTDAYLAELSADGSTLLMGTYLGAGGGISLNNNDLHLDAQQNAYFGGAQSINTYGGTYFPVTPGAFQQTLEGISDGFVVKFITQQQPSATMLTVSPATTAKPTDTVTLTATVTTSSTLTGTALPKGSVTFLNGSTTIGMGTLNSKGVATYSGMLAAGMYTITASYGGDAGFNASVSTLSATLTVTSASPSTTTLAVAPASVPYGTPSTLTASVMAGSSPATSGAVTFTAGSISLGMSNVNSSGVATLKVTPPVGVYSVVASYAGTAMQGSNTGFAASTSAGAALAVTKAATSTVLTSSMANAGTGVNVSLTATISSSAAGVSAPGGTVTFLSGAKTLGTGTIGTGGVATLVTSFAAANTYSLTAVYVGDTNYTSSTSGVLNQVVVVPGFTVAVNPSSLTIARGMTGVATLTITPTGGYSGSISLACGTLPAFATCAFAPVTVALSGAPVTDTLSIGTGTVAARLLAPTGVRALHGDVYSATLLWLPSSLLGLLCMQQRRKLRSNLQRIMLVLCLSFIGLAAISGCSGGGSTPTYTNATPAGTYAVPITATGSTGGGQSVSLTVVVQ